MSLPPSTVTLKRRRDEDPVQFLRVHESNSKSKRRLTDFVFLRQGEPQTEPTSTTTHAPSSVAEHDHDQLRRIKPLPRSASSQLPGTQVLSGAQTQHLQSGIVENSFQAAPPASNTLQTTSLDDGPATSLNKKQPPRRFHLSRSASTTLSTSVTSSRVQKPPILFVERRRRAKGSPTVTSSPLVPALNADPEKASIPAPVLKKPGQSARTIAPTVRTSQFPSQPRDVRLPSGLTASWSLDDQQLVEEMQRYTLQEIGYSIAEAEAPEPGRSPIVTPNKRPSRFKPKVPKLRYHERHPEELAEHEDQMEIEDFVEEDDDGDYIIETYIRVSADVMELDSNAETNFGFLVLNGQEDIDEFYSAEVDSDEDEDYDEDDENAENHYSADYPDEEVDSDDEYGRNPYQYVNDDDDEGFSDDSDGGTKYPWAKKPAWLRKSERSSDDEDND
ncbi:hypothetical protein D0Z07_6848 [Hyphodiscus hymeniophilus]|uniref:Transcription factor Iwr1 domain-containing protein n=1 Tax=Hyphodiscus hymeniophilus TaxID=353542 RepID=A0A9P6VH06_9HELO|nr:hypothetical protein D0Z07_6848 [Hyphodiscus hymeniophilus]